LAEVILKAQNIVKKYGDKEVLKGVNLDIKAGEIFGIIGSSGSGKTTLLNSLIGFVSPTKGEILFRDPHLLSYKDAGAKDTSFRNVLHYPKQVKEIFGFAAQDPSVYGKLSVMENLDLFGSLYNLSKGSRKTNAHILLKLMGLYNSRKFQATNLSGGMVKRLDIACSLIHDPKILILDEPTADLDPYLRRHMWDLIRKINKKGTTIIISSHYLDEIEELCDRIGVMSNGKMQNYGTPQEIKKMGDGSEEIHIRTESKRYEVLAKKLGAQKTAYGISQIRNNGSELIVQSKNPLEVIKLIVKTTTKIEDPIVDLRLNKPSLNEIFASFVEENQGGSLATHQQKVEAENEEMAKSKFWYRFRQKLFFWKGKKTQSKRHHKSAEHVVEQPLKSKSVKLSRRDKREAARVEKEAKRAVRKQAKIDKKSPRNDLDDSITDSVFSVFKAKGSPKSRSEEAKKPPESKSHERYSESLVVPKARSIGVRSQDKKRSFVKGIFGKKPRPRSYHSKSNSGKKSDETLSDLADLRKRIEKLRVDTSSLNIKRRRR